MREQKYILFHVLHTCIIYGALRNLTVNTRNKITTILIMSKVSKHFTVLH